MARAVHRPLPVSARHSACQLVGVVALALAIGVALPHVVQAQDPARTLARVVVIRSTIDVSGADAQQLDSLLLAELTRTGGLDAPQLATLELADIELAVGCSAAAVVCLRAVAGTVGAEALLLRRLEQTPAGLELVLTWFDPSSDDEPRSVDARAPDAIRLAGSLPHTVRLLFGVSEPVVAAHIAEVVPGARSVPTVRVDDSGPAVPVVPLVIAAAGAATLVVGAVFAALSVAPQERYATTPVHTAADADAALSALDEARSRALVANVAFGVGATLLVVGASWLVIELATASASSTETAARAHAQLGIAPLPGGAFFSLQGSL